MQRVLSSRGSELEAPPRLGAVLAPGATACPSSSLVREPWVGTWGWWGTEPCMGQPSTPRPHPHTLLEGMGLSVVGVGACKTSPGIFVLASHTAPAPRVGAFSGARAKPCEHPKPEPLRSSTQGWQHQHEGFSKFCTSLGGPNSWVLAFLLSHSL